jgi:PadR family transcriptional regulator PadR
MDVPSILDRVQGSLEMMILKTLLNGTMHGWGIANHIRARSREALHVKQGALYPALHRLEDGGFVRGEWGTSDNNRRARFYAITAAGRKHLAAETAEWKTFVRVIGLVMELA